MKCVCTKQQSFKICDEKQTELKGETDMYSYSIGYFISLSAINRTTRQKIGKDTEELKNTINKWDLIDIY